jgi:hypothetical protein
MKPLHRSLIFRCSTAAVATTAGKTSVDYRRRHLGGAAGNWRLTTLSGALLLVLLAVEGATIPFIRPLLSMHIFVGMLLLGPVALKLGSTGYRFVRYYTGAREYVELGPPRPLLRVAVAPVLVLSTMTLFGTGILLLVSPHRGAILGLHKASFIVWFAACSVHVLAYGLRTLRTLLETHLDGETVRIGLVVASALVGLGIALATYPLAAPWLHETLGLRH